ncbi:MAG: FKBP-type peptidyl-prolyl cis-trans isomerase [Bacteroidota bacterium]
MKRFLFLCTVIFLFGAVTPGFAQKKKKKKKKKGKQEQVVEAFALNNAIDSVSYAFGLVLGNNLYTEEVQDIDLNILMRAMKEAQKGESPFFDQQTARNLVNEHIAEKRKLKVERAKKEGEDYLAANALLDSVTVTESGLQYKILRHGTGPIPESTDKVITHYEGKLIDGTIFDSSYQRGESISFPVTGVIPGWQEALQLMPVGSKWQLVIPYNLAYGDRGAGAQIPPYATLIFEIELMGIQ